MPENTSFQLILMTTVKVNASSLRFVWMDDDEDHVWLVLGDALAGARCPRSLRRKVPNKAAAFFPSDHRVTLIKGRPTIVVAPWVGRSIFLKAAESGYCPTYLADVYEVVFQYAQDRLLSQAAPLRTDALGGLFGGACE